VFNFISRGVMTRFLVLVIRTYQKYLSRFFRDVCIYTPSCSQYSLEAIEKHGPMKGTILSFRRLLRCRPPFEGGIDPVE